MMLQFDHAYAPARERIEEPGEREGASAEETSAEETSAEETSAEEARAAETRMIETHLRVTLLTGPDAEPVEVELVSLNADQMLVHCPETLSPCTDVHLRFRMLSRRICEAHGQVVWRRDGAFGVAFKERNEGMERFLHELAKLTPNLRQIYLADILYPRIEVAT